MIIDGLQINDWSREVIVEVRSGGVDVVHATVGVWEDLSGAMARIGAFRHVCRNNEDLVRIVRSVDEIHEAVADGVLAVLLGFQNSTMLGDDPEMAGIFADVGIRVVQLTYNISNHLGSSCWEPHDGGLTRVGHRMVAALNGAGVLVDISHVGNRTGMDAVHASAAPIAITHGNPASFCDSPRGGRDPGAVLRHARRPGRDDRRGARGHRVRRRPGLEPGCPRVDAERSMGSGDRAG